MINRILGDKIDALSRKVPIVAVIGPRQSGKTTLLKHQFPKHTYISLEDLDIRSFAESDPRGFFSTYNPPFILDEVQRVPTLFSYLQTFSDKNKRPGQFILSGSQNFLLLSNISQSLAGRVAIVTLLPFSLEELQAQRSVTNLNQLMFTGFYPRIWDKKLSATDWYPSYIQTYLERDVRLIKQITNLTLFQKFLRLAAGRTAQILNLSSLASDVGVSHNTIRDWLSILEASFISFQVLPYYRNINKRVIKSPKLYFYDCGLVCALLGITAKQQLENYPLRGAIFETMVVAELKKYAYNRGLLLNDYFIRDKQGHEIDYFMEMGDRRLAVEIKSGQTITEEYFTNLKYWQKQAHLTTKTSFVIYGGKEKQLRKQGTVLGWQNTLNIFAASYSVLDE